MSEFKSIDDQRYCQERARLREVRSPSSVVNAAKIMGLNPIPTGANEDEWQAECPSTAHQLTMWSSLERWNCRQCDCGGAVDDLETLWRVRRLQIDGLALG